MTTRTPHAHSVLLDAARQLRAAARLVTQAADDLLPPALEAQAAGRLAEARANITAALARLDSYDSAEPAPAEAPPFHCARCGVVYPADRPHTCRDREDR